MSYLNESPPEDDVTTEPVSPHGERLEDALDRTQRLLDRVETDPTSVDNRTLTNELVNIRADLLAEYRDRVVATLLVPKLVATVNDLKGTVKRTSRVAIALLGFSATVIAPLTVWLIQRTFS